MNLPCCEPEVTAVGGGGGVVVVGAAVVVVLLSTAKLTDHQNCNECY
jgi:hypothetical protein